MVIDAGDSVNGLKKEDYAACYGGPYVYHGEVLSVPEGLCVKLSGEEMLKPVALIGIGAVAVHSVRRMKLQFGENVWVMGLGLLGQIIAQICWRANFRVFATDMNEGRCTKAKSFGIPHVYPADAEGLDKLMARETDGFGFDAVALCAHSNNPSIVDSAMGKLATGGKMAIVGNVPMNFSRELFFQKEADFRHCACSRSWQV
jgi:NADPH2:quinone reductase